MSLEAGLVSLLTSHKAHIIDKESKDTLFVIVLTVIILVTIISFYDVIRYYFAYKYSKRTLRNADCDIRHEILVRVTADRDAFNASIAFSLVCFVILIIFFMIFFYKILIL